MTSITKRLELYKGDERFASLGRWGVSFLVATLSTLRLRTISNFCKKQEMNFQKKLF